MTKYIFVTGGVVSGLGKGITGSSIGAILKSYGLTVNMKKFDPYLNIDPGTMNPVEHGEVYVTDDGGETDLDLGHYERFIDVNLSKNSSISSGKIYESALSRERKGHYLGKTVQIIPHITNLIKEEIFAMDEVNKPDITICEIGGTVGDIESQPFIEAIRQVRMEKGVENVMFVHVGLIPYLKISGEFKTKPIQHSVKELLSLGIQPDVIIMRSESDAGEEIKEKISLFCNIKNECVISCPDTESIYFVPLMLAKENIQDIIAQQFNLKFNKQKLDEWKKISKDIVESTQTLTVSLVGKYISLKDAYLSVVESLKIAGYSIKKKIIIEWINSRTLDASNYKQILKNSKGIIVTGGFGGEGFEGKILATQYARENNIPFLGLCLGMQIACVEFAKNVLKLENASSCEVDPLCKNPIIDIISGKDTFNIGGTLRLGGYDTTIKKNTLTHKLYGQLKIRERHRHRYEFNNKYIDQFEKEGFVFSGINDENNLIEIIEYPKNNFFIASQFHPEFTSRINKPNPLFKGFLQAIENNNESIK